MLKLGQVLTLKNCIEPFSYASTAYVVASALVSVRPICKNLSNLQKIFGQMVYRPPLAKNSPYAYADINLCTFFGLCLLKILLASSDHFYTVTFMSSWITFLMTEFSCNCVWTVPLIFSCSRVLYWNRPCRQAWLLKLFSFFWQWCKELKVRKID